MQPGYEGLDRGGGFSRVRMFTPLRHRDFRLLWSGMCVSLMGDGIFLVAMAWQVYALSNAPTALALVGIAMTVPTIAFLLVGGVASDRLERRWLLVGADLLRALAVALLAGLAIGGQLAVWHVVVLSAFYGTGSAFHAPAFDALVPEILRGEKLTQQLLAFARRQPLSVAATDLNAHVRAMPCGGYKNSGTGRERGIEELYSYTEEKSVHVML